MKYILMMHGQKGAWDEYARWSEEEVPPGGSEMLDSLAP